MVFIRLSLASSYHNIVILEESNTNDSKLDSRIAGIRSMLHAPLLFPHGFLNTSIAFYAKFKFKKKLRYYATTLRSSVSNDNESTENAYKVILIFFKLYLVIFHKHES